MSDNNREKNIRRSNMRLKMGHIFVHIIIPVISGLFIGCMALLIYRNMLISDLKSMVYKEVNVEYGRPITIDAFFDEAPAEAKFITNVSQIDTGKIASYKIAIDVNGQVCHSVLNVVDTTKPVAQPVPQEFYLGDVPDAVEAVSGIFDLTNYHIEYDNPEMDLSKGGHYKVGVRVTDNYGNSNLVTVPFYVKEDVTAPVIVGAKDIEVILGQPISYRQGVKAIDDYALNPKLEVDTSKVDSATAGVYPIKYIATDDVGNKSEVEVNLTIFLSRTAGFTKPEDAEKVAEAYKIADNLLSQIVKDDMTDVEKAMAIFSWVHSHIGLARGTSDYSSWAHAACKAFTKRYASCYGQWACCKALLDTAGIKNMCIKRWPKAAFNGRTHYWALVYLNNEWYHCDASRWQENKGYFIFMMTDDELERAMGNHSFDKSKYPERSTKSVQRYINIYNKWVSPNFPYAEEIEEPQ